MVGNSTCGRGATGSIWYAMAPARARPAVKSEVATGLRMNGAERLIALVPGCRLRRARVDGVAYVQRCEPPCDSIKEQIDDGRSIQSQHLTHDEAADDGDAERTPQFGSGAGAQGERHSPEQGGHGGHHDGPESQQ